MSESFFRRWSRRKAEQVPSPDAAVRPESPAGASRVPLADADAAGAADALPGAAASPANGRTPLPSMKDVAALAPDSDYSLFLASGVDKTVRRAAMKKLFSDPHFNMMDGLDIYIDDYTKPSPLPPGMLEALQHAKSTLEPTPLYKTDDQDEDEDGEAQSLSARDEEIESGAGSESSDAPQTLEDEAAATDAAGNETAECASDEQAPVDEDALQPAGQPPPQDPPITSTGLPPP